MFPVDVQKLLVLTAS